MKKISIVKLNRLKSWSSTHDNIENSCCMCLTNGNLVYQLSYFYRAERVVNISYIIDNELEYLWNSTFPSAAKSETVHLSV